MRFLPIILCISSVAFAGNFQRMNDTARTDYYPVYQSIPKYEHGLGMKSSPRVSPATCENVNCPKEKYPARKRVPVKRNK